MSFERLKRLSEILIATNGLRQEAMDGMNASLHDIDAALEDEARIGDAKSRTVCYPVGSEGHVRLSCIDWSADDLVDD